MQISDIQESIKKTKIQTNKRIDAQLQRIINQKDDTVLQINNLSTDIYEIINSISKSQEENNRLLNNEIYTIQDSISETKRQANEKIDIQDQRIIKQKEETFELINKLSSDVFEKIDSVSKSQEENNKHVYNEVYAIQDSISEVKRHANEKIDIQEQRITKQGEETFDLINKLSSDVFEKIDSVSKYQEEKNSLLNNEIYTIQDSISETKRLANEKIDIQDQRIKRQEKETVALINKLSSDVFDKIDSVSKYQEEENRNVNNEINAIKESISVANRQINEKIDIQEKTISKQQEEAVGLINKLSADVANKIDIVNRVQEENYQHFNNEINAINDSVREKEHSIHNHIKTQEEQLVKKIIIAYSIAGTFGAISLTHIALNILGIL